MKIQVIISIFAGLIIFGFFSLIKYRDELNKQGPIPYRFGYIPLYQPIGYQWVTQFITTAERRWFLYLCFLIIPYTIVLLLLAGILQEDYDVQNVYGYLILAAAVSAAYHHVLGIFRSSLVSEKLIHVAVIIIGVLVAITISTAAKYVDFGFVAPSIEGLFDNLWSSLLVASLVLVYSEITNPRSKAQDQIADKTALENIVVSSYNYLRHKHDPIIKSTCDKYLCSRPILYAVLIYENMNRPDWFRLIENTIVKITRLKLTVGLAQIRSDKPLTDGESIFRAGKILEGSIFADNGYGSGFTDLTQLEDILKKYNDSKIYAESIAEILSLLRRFTDAFNEVLPKYGGPQG